MEIKTFYSTKKLGPMSLKKEFYPSSYTLEDRIRDLKERRKILGELCGFDGTKMLVPTQKNSKNSHIYLDGKCTDAREVIEQNENCEDFWNIDIFTDMMFMDSSVTGIPVAFPVADCPVVTAYTKNYLVTGHCGGEYIDRYLPMQIIDTLQRYTNESEKSISVHISPCASFDSYKYNGYPLWAKSRMWNNFIEYKEESYYIDLRGAIMDQLINRKIRLHNIDFDQRDTMTDEELYSNSAYNNGNTNKNGRNLSGVMFVEDKSLKLTKDYY